jgi:tetratricopeptide (TPR) repeat protein
MMRLKLTAFLQVMLVVLCTSIIAYGQQTHESNLIKSYQSETNKKKKFSRLMALGEYYKVNNITKADSIRHIILKESRNFEDSIRFNALFYSAEIAQKTGNQEEYFRTIVSCQPFLNKLNSDEVQFKIYRHLGYYHSSMQEIETADFYLNLSIKLARKVKDNKKLSEAYAFLSKNFMVANQKDSALYYSNMAIKTARRIKDKSVLSQAFNTQAEVYSFFGQIELSVAKNLISLQMAEEAHNVYLLAKYTREIGQSQKLIANLDDAEYYFRRSLGYARQIHDKRQMALAHTNLASVQLERDEFSSAIKNANLSIKYLTDLNDLNGLGETHNILGMVYKEQKVYNLASSNFNQALVYYESTSNKEKIAGVYHNVGTVFKEQGKYKNSLNYLNRSIEIREQYGAQNQIYHTYRTIADVYKDINNTEKSLEYMELYLNYLDSNTTLQAATKIAELSESYRSEQRERLINSQADSIQRQQQERTLTATKLENSQLRNNFQMYIIVAFLIIIVLAGIIIFYRWNQTKIKQQQREAEMSQTLLRTQMNPHFVFNAMSVIQSYIYDHDTVNSSKFLVNFSRLMRLILENSPKEHISINTEIEILQKYLEMQKLRFEDRFEFDIIAEEILFEESAIIPPMITQPFIENAIEHGQLHTIQGGFIKVKFSKENEMLVISIIDNGIGRKGSKANKKSSAHKSMAMDITSQRIENLNKKYKTGGSLLVNDYNEELETGTKVLISLPYAIETNPIS